MSVFGTHLYRLGSQVLPVCTKRLCSSRHLLVARFASTFKAAVVTEFGSPLVIKDIKQTTLKANDVRIGVYCCGINSIDVGNISGEIEPKPKLPFVPGYEVCGEILEVAGTGEEASKLKVGQRVVGLDMKELQGGFAEEMTMSAKDVFKIDNSVSFSDGASLINSYATALIALSRRAAVEEGNFVLITGAAGRLGMACVDLAANVYRCKVIAATTSEERSSAVRDRGAYATVTLGKQNLKNQVDKVTEGQGVSVIIDCIGGDVFKEVIKCASEEGIIVVAGFASKKIPQISGDELMEKSISVVGVSLEQYRNKKYEVYREAVSEVIDLCKEKHIHPFSASHYALTQINEAIQHCVENKSVGKAVLDIR
ncbi:unnamed protein product [Allacma fusca]|uniref:Enoyl reductase (ER) domain-containing protein n=1 Tax=Allacma fusca TaxID=39272 RepID=A0A8J2M8S2_9HEXA|nr:unnamed protein product [Allacma fusca]